MARNRTPSILFFDEIDCIDARRNEGEHECYRRSLTEFLIQMQDISGVNQGVSVIAATNIPWGLSPAIRRR